MMQGWKKKEKREREREKKKGFPNVEDRTPAVRQPCTANVAQLPLHRLFSTLIVFIAPTSHQ